MNTQTNASEVRRLCEITTPKQSKMYWLTDKEINLYRNKYNYYVVILSYCKELEESVRCRQDKNRALISKDDILDTIIDINRLR